MPLDNRNPINFELAKQEMARYNSLHPDLALEYVRAAEAVPVQYGACMFCRPGQRNGFEPFAQKTVAICVICDYIYIRGYPSAAVVKRSRAKDVLMDDILLFHANLREAKHKIGLGRGNGPEDVIFEERLAAWRKSAVVWWTRTSGPKQVGVRQ